MAETLSDTTCSRHKPPRTFRDMILDPQHPGRDPRFHCDEADETGDRRRPKEPPKQKKNSFELRSHRPRHVGFLARFGAEEDGPSKLHGALRLSNHFGTGWFSTRHDRIENSTEDVFEVCLGGGSPDAYVFTDFVPIRDVLAETEDVIALDGAYYGMIGVWNSEDNSYDLYRDVHLMCSEFKRKVQSTLFDEQPLRELLEAKFDRGEGSGCSTELFALVGGECSGRGRHLLSKGLPEFSADSLRQHILVRLRGSDGEPSEPEPVREHLAKLAAQANSKAPVLGAKIVWAMLSSRNMPSAKLFNGLVEARLKEEDVWPRAARCCNIAVRVPFMGSGLHRQLQKEGEQAAAERRVAKDGAAYTMDEFRKHYGVEWGYPKWANARKADFGYSALFFWRPLDLVCESLQARAGSGRWLGCVPPSVACIHQSLTGAQESLQNKHLEILSPDVVDFSCLESWTLEEVGAVRKLRKYLASQSSWYEGCAMFVVMMDGDWRPLRISLPGAVPCRTAVLIGTYALPLFEGGRQDISAASVPRSSVAH